SGRACGQGPRSPEVLTSMGRLQGLVAVVTGAGSGIGRASALAFAHEGACVVGADLVAANVEQTAHEIASTGGSSEAVTVDVTNWDQVQHMVQTAVDRFGRLDVLFNNA